MKRFPYVFLALSGLLLSLYSYNLDNPVKQVFSGINIPIFNFILSVITNFGVVIVIMALLPFLMLRTQKKKPAGFILSTFGLSVILAFFLKMIFLRQRPNDVFLYPLISIINYSFPSMHSMAVFSVLPFLELYLPKQRIFWISYATLAAFSRLYFDFHYLSDVVFGMFAGYLVGSVMLDFYLAKNGQKKS